MNIIVDSNCQIARFITPITSGTFSNFEQEIIIPGAVYIIGTGQVRQSIDRIRKIIENNQATIVYSIPTEGSAQITDYVADLGIADLLSSNKMLLVCGGPITETYSYCAIEHFMCSTTEIDTNQHAKKYIDEVYNKKNKPYKFLFLNGEPRLHRQFLIKRLQAVLDQSLYSWLSRDYCPENFQVLPLEYEFSRYVKNLDPSNLQKINGRNGLFNFEAGEVYAVTKQYTDTYFSLVTETVFKQGPSFRTEKTWKPIIMGHPFVMAANQGFYKDLRNMGFKTFGHLIDESFDQISNSNHRLERIAQVVEDLCQQDLDSFLSACEPIARYNQQLVFELAQQHWQNIPDQINNFILNHAQQS
jgi:hypothetical protein